MAKHSFFTSKEGGKSPLKTDALYKQLDDEIDNAIRRLRTEAAKIKKIHHHENPDNLYHALTNMKNSLRLFDSAWTKTLLQHGGNIEDYLQLITEFIEDREKMVTTLGQRFSYLEKGENLGKELINRLNEILSEAKKSLEFSTPRP